MGCLFALLAGFFPRMALFILWLVRPALVGVILYTPGFGLTGWEWFWVILAAFFDLVHLAATVARRRELMRSAQRA